MTVVRIGYLPLTDAAPLIAAADFGFARAEGIEIDLQRDVSWANLRDKLMVGTLDAAHFLGAAAIACSLGFGHRRFPMRAPMLLSRNGNCITLSRRIADRLRDIDPDCLNNWRNTAVVLRRLIETRMDPETPELTLGTVFPFSTHTFLLRHFLDVGGMRIGRDVDVVVTPPAYAVDMAERGLIDGFCVGSPWNSMAVDQGKGVIAAFGSEIISEAPEKVLAMAEDSPLLSSDTGEALIRCLVAAGNWVSDPANRTTLSVALARPDRLGCPADMISRILSGDLALDSAGRRRRDPAFIRLGGASFHRPSSVDADWLLRELNLIQKTPETEDMRIRAQQVFSPIVFDRAVR